MGGNVWKDADGQPQTGPIKQTDIITTVQWLERLTGLDLTGERDADNVPAQWLGSTGRRAESGDIDLAVDATKFDKQEVYQRIVDWARSHNLDHRDWVRKSGNSVHVKAPINGNPDLGFVQADLMFLDNMPWARWALQASGNSEYRGSDRNILINSLAKSLGYKLNQNLGIMDRGTNRLISDDPDAVAKMLLNRRATRADLATVESILAALENDPDRDKKLQDARDHFTRTGTPFVESLDTEGEINWLARLRDRIVNQGMWVLIEDQQIKETTNIGGQAKGIEHIEDLVFRKGLRGVAEARHILKAAAEDTPGTVTVKWDGRPAIVFGRRPDTGDFVLTDTAGFQARGYDGLFTSMKSMQRELARRDSDAQARGKSATRVQELSPMFQELWPRLEAAWPRTLRGFVQGDVLYYPQRPWQEDAGNAVFRPNEIEYRIPLSSELGQKIKNSDIGIAVHTSYADTDSAKQPLGNIKFKSVPGLLLQTPIAAESIKLDRSLLKAITALEKSQGAAINQLFNPADLRSQQITDFASLCIKYINSRVGQGFDNLAQGFIDWLPQHVTQRKMNNIIEYLQSPSSNTLALQAAFDLWALLHELKMDVLNQLDLQHPGQEGWVMATPQGYAKAVNRMPGGFAARNRERNQ